MGGGRVSASPTLGHSLWTSRGTLIGLDLWRPGVIPGFQGRVEFPVLLLGPWSNRPDPGHCLFRAGAWTEAALRPLLHPPNWGILLGTASKELSHHQHLVSSPSGPAVNHGVAPWLLRLLGQGPPPFFPVRGLHWALARVGSPKQLRLGKEGSFPCPALFQLSVGHPLQTSFLGSVSTFPRGNTDRPMALGMWSPKSGEQGNSEVVGMGLEWQNIHLELFPRILKPPLPKGGNCQVEKT